jgi:hypothetical protein
MTTLDRIFLAVIVGILGLFAWLWWFWLIILESLAPWGAGFGD